MIFVEEMQVLLILFTVKLCRAFFCLWPEHGRSIVGGTFDSIKNFPYQAAILDENGTFTGTGAIIGKKCILTSAFMHFPFDSPVLVRVGTSDCLNGGQLLNVKDIDIHELFDRVYRYDVALLRLSEEIEYGETVKPIRMATMSAENGTSVVVSGLAHPDGNTTEYIKTGKQIIVDNGSCQKYYDFNLNESFLCANNPIQCPCTRDHGAPLIQNNELVGNFIGGSFCCDDKPHMPQLYNDVSNIREWAIEHMKVDGYKEEDNIAHYFGG